MKTLHISAGGRGERMASYISSIAPFLPKHLLPLPTPGKTILGEIVFRATSNFEDIRIWSSKETYPHIIFNIEKLAPVNIDIDAEMTGPLGPMIRNILNSNQRVYGCAGDFYCDFSWAEFEAFHLSHDFPVSILVAQSMAAPQGARFILDKHQVVQWERVERTTVEDFINMGCYIVEPDPEVIRMLRSMKEHKEDAFFDLLIKEGLVGGYNPETRGFNVNVPEIYESLLHALA